MIGIGGCGMSGAAAMLLKLGAKVTGTDLTPFAALSGLVSQGARIAIGHAAKQVGTKTDLVVRSAAVPDTNPEVAVAFKRGIPVIKYAELVGQLMEHHAGIGIAGTHGKTTTTAMTAFLFREAGLCPSFIFGADSPQLGGHSGVGDGPHFIVESCEFDRSFLHFRPQAAAILNIETDHFDCFASLPELTKAFGAFASQVAPSGLVLCHHEDEETQQAASAAMATVETFGFEIGADWRAVNLSCRRGCYRFDVHFQGQHVLSTHLSVPGRYNVANALAAIALAIRHGAEATHVAAALPRFEGVQRRMSIKGEVAGVTIVDDYAHHPTEVRVTLEAARRRFEPKRTRVVFQPHQYARTCQLMDEFARSFAHADEVIIPDIYAAREPGARAAEGAAQLADLICTYGGQAVYVPSLDDVASRLLDSYESGDLVVTMGAGDVWKVADVLVENICGTHGKGCTAGSDDLVSTGGTGPVSIPAA
ncbi:MAG: UDP-N-acetylmuramate--L-alanine ligase [Phycisphaerae bacterium]